MLSGATNDHALKNLTRDGWLLFLTRITRMFAYGALSVARPNSPSGSAKTVITSGQPLGFDI